MKKQMTQKEILFEREININATIKNIEKSGFGKKYVLIRDFPPQLFDKEKSIKEIKSKIKQAYKVPRIRLLILTYIGWGLILGTGLGISMGVLIHGDVPFLSFLTMIFLLIVAIIFHYSIRDMARKWQKWIFFPDPNTVVFAGDFAEEYINNFKKLIVWKKVEMILKSLRMKNFRKFKDSLIDFSDGVTGVIGFNGAGKSTIFEAIAWGIYGPVATRTPANQIKRENAEHSDPCRVEIEFIFGDDTYKVVREMIGKSLTASASVTVNGKLVANRAEAVSKFIQKKLGMDFKSFYTYVRKLR